MERTVEVSKATVATRTAAAMCLAVIVYVATSVVASLINDCLWRYLLGRHLLLIHFTTVLLYSGASVALAKCACDRWVQTYSARTVCYAFFLLVFTAWLGGSGTWFVLRWVTHDLLAQTVAVLYVALAVFA